MDTVLYLLGRQIKVPVFATFRYKESDPFAVSIDFIFDGTVTSWKFARELIKEGLRQPSGQGDITIWTAANDAKSYSIYFRLHSTEGVTIMEGDFHSISQWLEQSYMIIPCGAESLSIDWEVILRKFFEKD
ncbi:SsgA family sporulation/cell division regulator [Streptomyces sp. NPDC048508]|uniref:SsgA family sporulation/cell division regulator n=1 Tax=Streptomyces sp. NPDC048508 TaxID=3365561 RepID=UPI0037203D00